MALSRDITSAAVIYGLATLLGRLQFFVTLPIVAHQVPPEGYGLITIAGAVSLLFASAAQSTISGAVERFYADFDGEARAECLGTILSYLVVLIAVFIVVVVVGAPLTTGWFSSSTESIPRVVALGGITGSIAAINAFSIALLRIEERPSKVLLLGLVRLFSSVALVAFLVGVLSFGVIGYLGALLCVELTLLLVSLPYIKRRVRFRVRRQYLRQVLAFSLPLAPYALLSMVRDTGDRWILQAFVSLEELGLYGFAWSIAGAMNAVVGSLTVPYAAVMMKKFSALHQRTEQDNLADFIPAATHVMVLVLLCYAGYLLLVQDVISLLTPQRYHGSQIAAMVLGGVFVMRGLYLIPHNALQWMRRPGAIPICTAIGLIIGLPTIALTAPALGGLAGALGIGVTYVVSWFCMGWFLPVRRWLLPLRFKPVAASLVAVLGAGVVATISNGAATNQVVLRQLSALIIATSIVAITLKGLGIHFGRPRPIES